MKLQQGDVLLKKTNVEKNKKYLREANLRGADLRGASLIEADLSWASLRGADLRGASLRGANLRGADLRGASLSWASLREADLREANLRGADLRGASLRGASLIEADLSNLVIDKKIIQINTKPYSMIMIDNQIQIGCEIHNLDEWEMFGHIIAKQNNLTDEQIEIYSKYIEICKNINLIK